MKIFYDTEFLENGSTIRLISIGMVREDGHGIYRVVQDNALMRDVFLHPWLKHNVAPHLPYEMTEDGVALSYGHLDYTSIYPKNVVADDIKHFVMGTTNPELWAYYGAYDHVVLCQLFGRMVDLPTGFPMFTNDLKQEMVRLGSPRVPEQATGAHNAYLDALWNKETYEYLQRMEKPHRAAQALRSSDEARIALQDSFDQGIRD